MDVVSLISNIIGFIERAGRIEGFLIIIALISLFLLTKYIAKRIDKSFYEVKRQNEELKKENEKLKQDSINILESIEKTEKNKIDRKTNFLKNHPYFSTVDYLIDAKIPSLYFKSEFKKAVFIDLLTLKLKSSKEVYWHLSNNESNYNTGSLEFRSMLIKSVKDAYNKYSIECQRFNIPEIVIDSFNEWISPLTRFVFSTIEDISDSKLYETNVDKLNAILSIELAIFNEIISNLELFFDKINGDFDGLTYKGIDSEPNVH